MPKPSSDGCLPCVDAGVKSVDSEKQVYASAWSVKLYEAPEAVKVEAEAPADLPNLIKCLEQNLAGRFDRLELQLDQIGKEILSSPSLLFKDADPEPVPKQAFSDGCRPLVSDDADAVKAAGSGMVKAVSLPAQEKPQPYNIRKEWRRSGSTCLQRGNLPSLGSFHAKTLNDVDLDDESRIFDLRQAKPWYIIWPSSTLRLVWDLATMFLVAHDMAVIPVHLGFFIGENAFSKVLHIPTMCFWTLDIPLTFLTGFFYRGHVETSLKSIAVNYICSWLLLDLCIVASSWTEVVIGMDTDGIQLGRVGKTLRFLQIIRSMRLLRLMKLQRILEDLQDRITSEYFHIIMVVCKLSIVIVWTNHFIACAWWYIGSSDPETSWTTRNQLTGDPLAYQYFTALHWSLTQFTPASMEIAPTNVAERVFAVFTLAFAMIVFSSFVSSITTAMTQLRNLSNPVARSFVTLRRYLKARDVPPDLTLRIIRCVASGLKVSKAEIPESDVELLKYLSPPLHMELLSQVHSPTICVHPLFARIAEEDPIAMQWICRKAITRICLSNGDTLFSEACTGDTMYFVERGRLRYVPHSSGTENNANANSGNGFMSKNASTAEYQHPSPIRMCNQIRTMASFKHAMSFMQNTPEPPTARPSLSKASLYRPRAENTVEVGEWFCEPSLWCPWHHTGTMLVLGFTELLSLDSAKFASVISTRRLVVEGCASYGSGFVKRLNADQEEGAISDVCPFEDEVLQELVGEAFPMPMPERN